MKPLAQNTLIQNRYLIVHLIGKGGMGEVYLAVDQRLGSAVALKRTFFAGDEMLGNAFEREARTLARMRHPVLPKVSDHFGEGDEQYLVMEHISGDDLSKRLEAAGKPFPVSWVLFWADQLLDALSYLHTHEPPIIHRDIKPQNLKLTDENHIILLDFGLSKTSTGQTNVSQSGSTGSVVGYTPHYAPMEQIRGIGTSARSDLYSLSATLYQLMTNTVPADALSRADSMLNGLPDPIQPPSELNPEISKSVSDVILRAMEVSQEKRYANAREMQRVLRKAFSEIQQATMASTVAFSAEQAADLKSVIPQEDAVPNGQTSQPSSVDADEPAGVPDVDLDATMAYDPAPPGGEVKQSDVRTEVFLAGNSSFPSTGNSTARPSADLDGSDSTSESSPNTSQPGGYVPEATVPFVALDQNNLPGPAETQLGVVSTPAEPEFFADERKPEPPAGDEVPYFRSADSEPEAAAAAAPYAPAAQPVVRPAKKSSGKIIAIVGGLAALLVLGLAVGGGLWAYATYGGGFVTATPTPTPVPTPEETPTPTPSPEPTIDSNLNSNIGNSNVGGNSVVNTDSNSSPSVDPTPERTPAPDTPSGTRPTPRPQPTSKPASTPIPRPTRGPVTIRTPLP